jgi:dolichol-phosphate mannosyltransferase
VRPDDVTVVVPTYNETLNIAHMIAAVRLGGYSILVVDDGSPDGTGAVVDEIAALDPSVGVIHRPAKNGIGPAYAAGFDRALADGATVVVEMDADFSHNPNDLPRLIDAIEAGADLVIGSRYVPGGSTPDWPVHRRLISRGGNLYARFMLGVPVQDATAGFRAFRAEALRKLPYHQAQASGYGFQVEMAWRAVTTGLEVVEIPVVFRDREQGNSKMNGRIVLEAMALVTLWGLRRGMRLIGSSLRFRRT